jgi:uncharacterized RDD family membrane protein YckC
MASTPFETHPSPGDEAVTADRAGFWIRFGAAFVDGVIFAIVNVVLSLAIDDDAAGLIAFVLGLAYYIVLEGGTTGQTIGKRLVGIRVVSAANGGPLGYGSATVRYFGRILSSIPILLGYFWMLWDGEKQTWHDKLAGSYVVPVASAPVTR